MLHYNKYSYSCNRMLTIWIGWAGSLCLASPACSNQCSGHHEDVDKFQHLLQTHIDFSRLPPALSLPAQAFQFDCIDFCSFCDTGLKLYYRPSGLLWHWLGLKYWRQRVAMAVHLNRIPPLLLITCKVFILPHWNVRILNFLFLQGHGFSLLFFLLLPFLRCSTGSLR